MWNKPVRGKKHILGIVCFVMIAYGLIWHSTAEGGVKLKKSIPELCFNCHKELEESLGDKFLHILFKKGECIKCHNSHVSTVSGLLDDRVDSLCLNCHEELRRLIDSGHIHTPLRNGNCSECHNSHSGNYEHLLVEEEKGLCVKCHKKTIEQAGKAYGCLPFKKGECSECHDSHATENLNLLKSDPNTLCKECHAPRCKPGNISISSLVEKLDCTSCHSGHGSDNRGALGPFGHNAFINKECDQCHEPLSEGKPVKTRLQKKDLCFSCHQKDDYVYVEDNLHVKGLGNRCNLCHSYHSSENANFTRNERKVCINCHEKTEARTEEMERILKTTECKPVRERKCFECHLPGHSDEPLGYRGDGIEMCARCHKSEHSSSHPVGRDIIDPRSGQYVTCISCHSMHTSRADYMLTHDRNRSLCIQCHKI